MRKYLLVIALVCTGSASAVSASQQDCRSDRRMTGEATTLLLDRTTVLDASAKERWRRGVSKLFADPALRGDLRIMEVRSSATELRTLGSSCVDQPPTLDNGRQGGPAGGWQAVKEWWAGPTRDPPSNRRRQLENRRDREALIRAAQNLADKDDPTPTQTEISQSIVALLQSRCSGTSRCELLVFSDFLDATAKTSLRAADPRRAGASRAERLLAEYSPDLRATTLVVRGWGFGRDDARPGSVLDDQRRERLRSYWTGFFDALRRHAAGGSTQLVDFL